jgi:hypothetical protein
MLDDLNFVLAVALIGVGMKEASIFISFNSNSNLASLFPH